MGNAQAEAWLREKPKRIIQSQALMVLLGLIISVGILPFIMVLFWLVFGIYPSVAVPLVLISWAVATVMYICYESYVIWTFKIMLAQELKQ